MENEQIICRYGHVKNVIDSCSGPFCEPDGTNAYRFAANFSIAELRDRIGQIKEDIARVPGDCQAQAVLNEFSLALEMRGGMEREN